MALFQPCIAYVLSNVEQAAKENCTPADKTNSHGYSMHFAKWMVQSSSPLHASSDIVEKAFSILVFCSQSVFDNKLTLLQSQLFIKLYNFDIARGAVFAVTIFRCLQETVRRFRSKSDQLLVETKAAVVRER